MVRGNIMRKFLFCLFSLLILTAFPLKALELDKDMIDDMSRSLSRALPPTIVGPDDRKEITGKAEGAEKAVVVFDMTFKQNYLIGCSGAMIGNKTVLTAAHCLMDMKGNYVDKLTVYATGIQMQKQQEANNVSETHQDTEEDDNSFEAMMNRFKQSSKQKEKEWEQFAPERFGTNFLNAKATSVWVPNGYKEAIRNNDYTKRHNNDYGIIFLDSELGKEISQNGGQILGLKALSEQDFYNIDIVVIGRGNDKSAYSLWKSPGHIKKKDVSWDTNEVYFDADIVIGNSGSPVFKTSDPNNIIALAVEETPAIYGFPAPNVGLPIRQEIVNNINKVKKGEEGFKSHPLPKDK